MSSKRRMIGKITSPFFVPLRRLIAWSDEKFGTCDHQLVLQPRPCYVDFTSNQTNDVSAWVRENTMKPMLFFTIVDHTRYKTDAFF